MRRIVKREEKKRSKSLSKKPKTQKVKKKGNQKELRLPRKLDRPQQRSTTRRKVGTLSVRALRMVFDDSVMKNRETGPT